MIDLSFAFTLPPQAAIDFFKSKGYALTFNWRELEAAAHARAFTVAGILKQDVLEDIRGSLLSALENGTTFQDFKNEMIPLLEKKGWLGKGYVVNQATGELEGRRVAPHRLKTIFHTNIQSALNAGRYQQQLENASARPYWQYIAIMDSATRPAHAALNGKVWRFDDPIWKIIYPPNGWGCRCRVIALSLSDIERMGLQVESSAGNLVDVEQPIGRDQVRTVTAYRDPATNKLFLPDGGFGFNVGSEYLASLGQQLLNRSVTAEPHLAAVAVHETFKNQRLFSALSRDVKNFVTRVTTDNVSRGYSLHVGAIHPEVIDALNLRNLSIESAAITVTDDSILHALRDTKDDKLPIEFFKNISFYLTAPQAVLLDKNKKQYALNYLFTLPQVGKLIIALDSKIKVRNFLSKKEVIKTNLVKSGKLLKSLESLKNDGLYEVVWGSLD